MRTPAAVLLCLVLPGPDLERRRRALGLLGQLLLVGVLQDERRQRLRAGDGLAVGVGGGAVVRAPVRFEHAHNGEGGAHGRVGGDGDRLRELGDAQGVEEALGDHQRRGGVVDVLAAEPAALLHLGVVQGSVAQAHRLGGDLARSVGEGEAQLGRVGGGPGARLVPGDEGCQGAVDPLRGLGRRLLGCAGGALPRSGGSLIGVRLPGAGLPAVRGARGLGPGLVGVRLPGVAGVAVLGVVMTRGRDVLPGGGDADGHSAWTPHVLLHIGVDRGHRDLPDGDDEGHGGHGRPHAHEREQHPDLADAQLRPCLDDRADESRHQAAGPCEEFHRAPPAAPTAPAAPAASAPGAGATA